MRARGILGRVVLVAMLAGSVLTACSLLTSYDGLEGATKADAAVVPTDSSVADAADAAVPVDPCTSEGVPPPPDGGPVTGDVGRLVGALRTLQFIDGDAGSPYGLNMDRTCGSSCVSSAASPPKDPPSGIDNSAFALFQTLKGLNLNLGDQGFNDAVKLGQWGLVVRLDGYSGTADDDVVQLELLNAAGVNNGGSEGARFDGTDEWIIDSTSMVAGVSFFRSKLAYVRGNVLVARFDRFAPTLRISGGGSVVLVLSPELFSVTVTAKIVAHADGGLTLEEGKLVGAMPPEQFLLQIQRLGVCTGSNILATAVDYVCGVRDLASTLTAPITEKCSQISTVLAFDTIPARVAPATKDVSDVRGCDGGDPTVGCGAR